MRLSSQISWLLASVTLLACVTPSLCDDDASNVGVIKLVGKTTTHKVTTTTTHKVTTTVRKILTTTKPKATTTTKKVTTTTKKAAAKAAATTKHSTTTKHTTTTKPKTTTRPTTTTKHKTTTTTTKKKTTTTTTTTTIPPVCTGTGACTSPQGKWDGCHWNIDNGAYKYSSRMYIPPAGWNTSAFLSNSSLNGGYFVPSTAQWGTGTFDPSRVVVASSGNLHLNVIGVGLDSTATTALGAQMTTSWSDIKYGSVRTIAKGDRSPGAIFGAFFYRYDEVNSLKGLVNESDIELRTTFPRRAFFTNDKANGVGVTSNFTLPNWGYISDEFHEYRLDWVPGATHFYIDGVLKLSNPEAVPRMPGAWYWNAWSNNGNWSLGPAVGDNTFYINSIDLYVNRTSVKGCGTSAYRKRRAPWTIRD